jgi:hypothetical protein
MVRQTSLLQQPSQQEAQPSQQYQRFLEAAERLGPHLESLFRKGFVQIVSPSRDKRAEVGVRREPAVDPRGALVRPEHATPSNWQDPLSRAPSQTPESEAVDVSIIVRLHFVEAMMVLLFNASTKSAERNRARLWQAIEQARELGDIRRPAGSTRGISRRSERGAEDAGEQSRTGRDRSRPRGRFREADKWLYLSVVRGAVQLRRPTRRGRPLGFCRLTSAASSPSCTAWASTCSCINRGSARRRGQGYVPDDGRVPRVRALDDSRARQGGHGTSP